MNDRSSYEHQQLVLIQKWKGETPGVVTRAVSAVTAPLAWVVNKLVPSKAMEAALTGSNALAKQLTDTGDILRDGGVASIDELQGKDLALSDKLANEVHNWAIGIAAAEGAATGTFGLPGMVADIPALITLSLRTIHKIGLCYGFTCEGEAGKQQILGILQAAASNSMEEKVAALELLHAIRAMILKQTWNQIAQKAAQEKVGVAAGIQMIKALAKQLGINITKRKALAAIPVIGAAVGGSMNAWYMTEVGWAARRSFQELWLESAGGKPAALR